MVTTLPGQSHGETRAVSRIIVENDRAALGIDDCFHEAEAKTEAALRTAEIATAEPEQNSFALRGGRAGSAVGDGENYSAGFGAIRRRERAGGWRVVGRYLSGCTED